MVDVRARARATPRGNEIKMVKAATIRVSEKPPKGKSRGTSTVDGVLTAVISHDVTPSTPNQPTV